MGASYSLATPVPLIGFAFVLRRELAPAWRWGSGIAVAAMMACSLFVSVSYENPCPLGLQLRSAPGLRRNGRLLRRRHGPAFATRGITQLTPITKFMAHMPLAFHKDPPESALVICFGMGTTFRSLLTWNVRTTAVELVPSVREAFPYYHEDAASVLANPKGRIVIDDGRRFLNRTRDTYDAIAGSTCCCPSRPRDRACSTRRNSTRPCAINSKPGGIFQMCFHRRREHRARDRAIAEGVLRTFASIAAWKAARSTSSPDQPLPGDERGAGRGEDAARGEEGPRRVDEEGPARRPGNGSRQRASLRRVLPARPSIPHLRRPSVQRATTCCANGHGRSVVGAPWRSCARAPAHERLRAFPEQPGRGLLPVLGRARREERFGRRRAAPTSIHPHTPRR